MLSASGANDVRQVAQCPNSIYPMNVSEPALDVALINMASAMSSVASSITSGMTEVIKVLHERRAGQTRPGTDVAAAAAAIQSIEWHAGNQLQQDPAVSVSDAVGSALSYIIL